MGGLTAVGVGVDSAVSVGSGVAVGEAVGVSVAVAVGRRVEVGDDTAVGVVVSLIVGASVDSASCVGSHPAMKIAITAMDRHEINPPFAFKEIRLLRCSGLKTNILRSVPVKDIVRRAEPNYPKPQRHSPRSSILLAFMAHITAAWQSCHL
jgi:hypothetical protein